LSWQSTLSAAELLPLLALEEIWRYTFGVSTAQRAATVLTQITNRRFEGGRALGRLVAVEQPLLIALRDKHCFPQIPLEKSVVRCVPRIAQKTRDSSNCVDVHGCKHWRSLRLDFEEVDVDIVMPHQVQNIAFTRVSEIRQDSLCASLCDHP
jgi:hypothetical protein